MVSSVLVSSRPIERRRFAAWPLPVAADNAGPYPEMQTDAYATAW